MEHEVINNKSIIEAGIWIIAGLLVLLKLLIIYIWQKNEARQKAQEEDHMRVEEKMYKMMDSMNTQQSEFIKYSSKIEVLVERHDQDIRSIWQKINRDKK